MRYGSQLWAVLACVVMACTALAAGPAAQSAEWPQDKGRGQLKWKQRTVAVTAKVGEKTVKASFEFRNQGKSAVTITGAQTACGSCTVAKLEKPTYAPGEQGVLEVEYAIAGKQGEQRKAIVVRTDDKSEPLLALVLKVQLPVALSVQPLAIHWGPKEKAAAKRVTLKVEQAQPIKLAKVKCVRSEGQPFVARLEEVAGGREYALVITPANTTDWSLAVFEFEAAEGSAPLPELRLCATAGLRPELKRLPATRPANMQPLK